MIVIQIQGGLGNQLFQYAFGEYIKKQYGVDVYYNVSFFSNQIGYSKSGNTLRNFDLIDLFKYYNIDLNMRLFIVLNKYYCFYNRLLKKNGILFCGNKFYKYVKESDNLDLDVLLGSFKNIVFEGYWQHSKYITGDFLKVFQNAQLSFEDEFQKKIIATESVSVHIRRDDYRNHNLFVVLSNTYYNNSIKFLGSKIENPFFFIFSDDCFDEKDHDFFEKVFRGNYLIIRSDNSVVDFINMSICKHNIIANSTYSWWASCLNSFSNKIIISPLSWTNNKVNNEVIDVSLLNGFVKIDDKS